MYKEDIIIKERNLDSIQEHSISCDGLIENFIHKFEQEINREEILEEFKSLISSEDFDTNTIDMSALFTFLFYKLIDNDGEKIILIYILQIINILSEKDEAQLLNYIEKNDILFDELFDRHFYIIFEMIVTSEDENTGILFLELILNIFQILENYTLSMENFIKFITELYTNNFPLTITKLLFNLMSEICSYDSSFLPSNIDLITNLISQLLNDIDDNYKNLVEFFTLTLHNNNISYVEKEITHEIFIEKTKKSLCEDEPEVWRMLILLCIKTNMLTCYNISYSNITEMLLNNRILNIDFAYALLNVLFINSKAIATCDNVLDLLHLGCKNYDIYTSREKLVFIQHICTVLYETPFILTDYITSCSNIEDIEIVYNYLSFYISYNTHQSQLQALLNYILKKINNDLIKEMFSGLLNEFDV